MPNDNLKKLHSNLSKKWKGFNVSYEQFEKDMQDEANISRLHKNLTDKWDGFKVPLDDFRADMGYVKKKDKSDSPSVSQSSGEVSADDNIISETQVKQQAPPTEKPKGIDVDFGVKTTPQTQQVSTTRVQQPLEEKLLAEKQKEEIQAGKETTEGLRDIMAKEQGIEQEPPKTVGEINAELRKVETRSDFHQKQHQDKKTNLKYLENKLETSKAQGSRSEKSIEQREALREELSKARLDTDVNRLKVVEELNRKRDLLNAQYQRVDSEEEAKAIGEKIDNIENEIKDTQLEATWGDIAQRTLWNVTGGMTSAVTGLGEMAADTYGATLGLKDTRELTKEKMLKKGVDEDIAELFTKDINPLEDDYLANLGSRVSDYGASFTKDKDVSLLKDLTGQMGEIVLEFGVGVPAGKGVIQMAAPLAKTGKGLTLIKQAEGLMSMPGYMAVSESGKEYGKASLEGKDIEEIRKAGLEGLGQGSVEGVKLMLLGTVSGRVAGLTKEKAIADVLGHGYTSVLFGGDAALTSLFTEGKVDWDATKHAAMLGLVFGAKDLGVKGVTNMVRAKSNNTFLNATPQQIKEAREVPETSTQLREKSFKLFQEAYKEKNEAKMLASVALNKVADIKDISELAKAKPEEYKEQIEKSELAPEDKARVKDNIDYLEAEISPRASEISNEINKLEAKKKSTEENKFNVDENTKSAKIEGLDKQIKEKKQELYNEVNNIKPEVEPTLEVEKKPTKEIEPTLEVEQKPIEAPTKEKPFLTKSKKQKVYVEDGELYIENVNGKEPTNPTIRKAKREYIESLDLDKGKEVEPYIEGENFREASERVVETTDNPRQLLAEYENARREQIEQENVLKEGEEYSLIKALRGSVKQESYERFGDPKFIESAEGYHGALKGTYIAPKGVENPVELDVIPKSEHSGYRGTENYEPQFVVDLMEKYYKGEKQYLEEQLPPNKVIDTARERFKDLTGLNISEEIVERAVIEKFKSEPVREKLKETLEKEYFDEVEFEKEIAKIIEKDIVEKSKDIEAVEKEIKEEESITKIEKDEKRTIDKGEKDTDNIEVSKPEEIADKGERKEYNQRVEDVKKYYEKKAEITKERKETIESLGNNIQDLLDSFGGISKAEGGKRKSSTEAIKNIATDIAKLTGLKGKELVLEVKKRLKETYGEDKKMEAFIDANSKVIEKIEVDRDLFEKPTDKAPEVSEATGKVKGIQDSYTAFKEGFKDFKKGHTAGVKDVKKQREAIESFVKDNQKDLATLAGRKSVSLMREINKANTQFQIDKVLEKLDKITTDEAFRKDVQERTDALNQIIKQTSIEKGGEKKRKVKESLKVSSEERIEELEYIKDANEIARKTLEDIEFDYIESQAEILRAGEQRLEDISKGKITNPEKYNDKGLTIREEAKLFSLDMIGDIYEKPIAEVRNIVEDFKKTIKSRREEAKREKEKLQAEFKQERTDIRNLLSEKATAKNLIKDLKSQYEAKVTKIKSEYKGQKLKSKLLEANKEYLSEKKKIKETTPKVTSTSKEMLEGREAITRKSPSDQLVSDSSWRSLMSRASINTIEKDRGVFREELNKKTYEKHIMKAERNEMRDKKKYFEEVDSKLAEIMNDGKNNAKLENKIIDGETVKDVVITIENAKGKEELLPLTQMEAANYYNHLKSIESMKDFFSSKKEGGMGWTDKTVSELNKQLKPEFKKIADWMFEQVNNEKYDIHNSEYRKQNGINLTKLENYWMKSAKAKTEKGTEVGDNANTRMNATSRHHIERVKAPVEIVPKSMLDSYIKYTEEIAHYKNWAEPVKRLNNMFINPKTKDVIEKTYGTEYYNNIKRFIERFAGSEAKKNNELVDAMTSKFTKGALYLSRSVGLKQMISSEAYAAEVGHEKLAYYLGKVETTKEGKEIKDFLRNQAFVKYRNGAPLSLEFAKPGKYKKYTTNNKVLKTLNKLDKVANTLGAKKIERALSFNIRVFDKIPIVHVGSAYFMAKLKESGMTWKEAKSKAEVLAKEKNITEYEALEQIVKEPLEKWDSISSATQQSNYISDISNLRADNPMLRIVTTFTSGPSQIHRVSMSGFRDIKKGIKTNDKKLAASGARKVVIAQMAIPILYGIVGNGMQFDPEEAKWNIMLGNVNGLPIVGKGLTAMASVYRKSNFGAGQLSPMVENIYKAVEYYTNASEAYSKYKDTKSPKHLKRAIKYYTKLSGSLNALMGVPQNNAISIYEDIDATVKGETQRPIQQLLGLESEYETGKDVFEIGKDAYKQISKGKFNVKEIFTNQPKSTSSSSRSQTRSQGSRGQRQSGTERNRSR